MPQSKFWEEVEQAYNKVAANHELIIEVAREGKSAVVQFDTVDPEGPVIDIFITQVPTEVKEPLISP